MRMGLGSLKGAFSDSLVLDDARFPTEQAAAVVGEHALHVRDLGQGQVDGLVGGLARREAELDEALARQLAAEDQYQLAVSSRPSAQLAASFEEEGSSAGPLVPPTSAAEEEAMVERALAESWRDAA